jgi:hypothetical protein
VHKPTFLSFGGVGSSQQLIAMLNAAAFFEGLFLSNGRFDERKHFYDNAFIR